MPGFVRYGHNLQVSFWSMQFVTKISCNVNSEGFDRAWEFCCRARCHCGDILGKTFFSLRSEVDIRFDKRHPSNIFLSYDPPTY